METTLTPLCYAKSEPKFWQRRTWHVVLIFGAVVVALIAIVLMNWRFIEFKKRLWDERRRYYETAAETMAADHVVWEDQADAAESYTAVALRQPPRQVAYVASAQGRAVRVDPPGRWEGLFARMYTAGREPVLFQHEMETASGLRVLVAVQFVAVGPAE